MKSLNYSRQLLLIGTALLIFFTTGCAGPTYVYQNGTTYNDYEVATNYRIKSVTSKRKIHSSSAPNWRKYNQQNKYKRSY